MAVVKVLYVFICMSPFFTGLLCEGVIEGDNIKDAKMH